MKNKWKEWFSSIHFKIVAIMVSFCVVLFLVVWLFQVVLLDNFYRGIKTNAIQKSSHKIVDAIQNMRVDFSMKQEFDAQLNSLSMENDACALIRNISNGFEVKVTTNAYCPIRNLSGMNVQRLYQFADEHGGEWSSFVPSGIDFTMFNEKDAYRKEEQQTLIHVQNTKDQAGNDIAVIMATIIRPVNIVRDVLVRQLWNVMGVIVFCSLVVSYFLSKLIASPIHRMNEDAKALATGNYDVTFDGKGYKEIEELSGTLNYAAKELGKVDSLRQELIANVSHDLRTPLTMISGYAEVMRDIPGENTPENVQIIIDEANRLSSMVNNLLDISKLQANADELHLEEVNFTELLVDIVNRYQQLLKPQNFEFEFVYDACYEVYVDRIRMQQVVYNLLNNAVNYSKDCKKIVVKQVFENGYLRIDIIDQGIGVKKEDLPYIFNRYYKVDKNHQMGVSGSGLGLSIVKTILDAHKMKYGVISEYGKGSDFYFVMPGKVVE